MKKENETYSVADAIARLRKALMSDPQYYDVWKANIAMAFYDEFRKECLYKTMPEIANLAACRFIDQLCTTAEDPPIG